MGVFTYSESSPWGEELHKTGSMFWKGRGKEDITAEKNVGKKRSAVSLGWLLLQSKERVPLNDMGSGHATPKLHSHSTHLKMHLENFGTENLSTAGGLLRATKHLIL